MSENRQNVNITVPPTETFEVEEGLPPLATTGRSGQSKYSDLMAKVRELKPNSYLKVPCGSAEQKAFIRNLRVAIKRFASGQGLKVTASGADKIAIYREAAV